MHVYWIVEGVLFAAALVLAVIVSVRTGAWRRRRR